VRAQATKTYYNSRDEVLQLWCHETCRIIADRMWDASDKEWLRKQLDEKLQVTGEGSNKDVNTN
jgi:dynein heavy chain